MAAQQECLTIGGLMYMPHMIIIGGDFYNPIIKGTMLEVLDIIFSHLGYCYRIIGAANLSAGSRLPNNTWTGVLGHVLRQEMNMTGTGLALTHDRAEALDFSEYLYLEESSAAYKRPVLQPDVAGFLRPFTGYMWCSIWLTVVGVILSLALFRLGMLKILPRSNRQENDGFAEVRDVTPGALRTLLSDGFLVTLSALLSQGLPRIPPEDSTRVLTALWLVASLILGTVYRSNLKAMLILPRITIPFDNLEELADSGLPVWTATNSLIHVASEKAPQSTALGRLSRLFNSVNGPINVPWGVADLVRGKHAIAAPRTALVQILHETFSKTGRCANYIMSEGFLKPYMLTFFFPKGSPLKGKVDPLIMRLREFGLLDYIYKKGVANATECLKPISSTQSNELRTLALGDFYGVFSVYAGGVLLALIIFLVELMLGNHPNRR
ncbi:glutamate receptor 1-like isoform X1 [Penaeus vannamei]|uniref:glutamate receptor 1-like isoform X1 n=1 Tax=Penaeus vannamei TaxID=6689 RepID=UPI00387F8D5D